MAQPNEELQALLWPQDLEPFFLTDGNIDEPALGSDDDLQSLDDTTLAIRRAVVHFTKHFDDWISVRNGENERLQYRDVDCQVEVDPTILRQIAYAGCQRLASIPASLPEFHVMMHGMCRYEWTRIYSRISQRLGHKKINPAKVSQLKNVLTSLLEPWRYDTPAQGLATRVPGVVLNREAHRFGDDVRVFIRWMASAAADVDVHQLSVPAEVKANVAQHMPATTRSKSQTTLEDKGVSSSKPAPSRASGAKRKAPETKTPVTKKQKTQSSKQEQAKTQNDVKDEASDDKDASDSITINRAPVLELWSSCVTQFLHPNIPWSTALSVGSAISTITAISKGRSIGTIDKPSAAEASEKNEKRKEAQADLDEIDVMSFHLKIKDGAAMVGDKPKKGNEEILRKKYGEEEYEKAKKVFQDALKQWEGKEDELDSRAFHMYEDFRPSVPKGQKGWGRKGQLNLESVESAVAGE